MRIDASQSICMLARISLFLFMRRLRRPATLHRVGIGGIHAHVDAALPFAFERVGHFQLHLTDLLDFDLDRLAVLQRTEAFVVGAAAASSPPNCSSAGRRRSKSSMIPCIVSCGV